MGVKEKIEDDFKQALKKREKIAVSTLRMLKAAIHNREIETKGEKLQDTQVLKIIARQAQQHQDSIEQFSRGKRDDLVEKETKELEILKGYLPRQLSPQEIGEVVKKIVVETGAKEGKEGLNFGKVMKSAMAELKGQADGKLVSQIAHRLLNEDKKE